MTTPPLPEHPGVIQPPLFHLGRTVATPGAASAYSLDSLFQCLKCHVRGDWGSVCQEDQETNDRAVIDGDRILSAYPIDPAKPCKGYGENCLILLGRFSILCSCGMDGV